MTEAFSVQGLSFQHPEDSVRANPQRLFVDFSLAVGAGEITAIMGPSGSGKSSLGRIIARILRPADGRVAWHDSMSNRRDVVYVDQEPWESIWPWLTVRENISAPQEFLGRDPRAAADRTNSLMSTFRLGELPNAYPRELSGGERRRLALARCLSWSPRAVIIDETLSSQDPVTRGITAEALRFIVSKEGTTLLVITHYSPDAMALCDRVVVLGERPVQVRADLRVDLPHPRDLRSSDYDACEREILRALRQ